MVFEWEYVSNFIYVCYYLIDFICLYLHMYLVTIDFMKLL